MEKGKIFLLNETEKNHRYTRLVEEGTKLGLEFVSVDVSNLPITNEGIILEGKPLAVSSRDMMWATSNTDVNHYIINLYRQRNEFFSWPSPAAVNFSDKFHANAFYSAHGIPTPRTAFINSYNLDAAVDYVGGFPCVIKKTDGSHGKQVELVHSKQEALDFMTEMYQAAKESEFPFEKEFFIVQQYIAESAGTDFRVLCVGGKIVGAMQRKAKEGFKANISLGGTAEMVDIDDELKQLCQTIIEKGNIFYAGLDFIKSDSGYLAIEINTTAQFKGFEKATGKNVAQLIAQALLEKQKVI